MTKTILIQSYRGGTGKSSVTLSLAKSMIRKGKKVAILDLDIESPGLGNLLNLKFQSTLTDYLIGTSSLNNIVYDLSARLSKRDGQLLLVPSSPQPGIIAEILKRKKFDAIPKVIEKLKDFNPDYILIDTHPGMTRSKATFDADIVLHIMRPDNQDYQGMNVAMAFSRVTGKETYVVLNQVHEKLDVEKEINSINNTFNVNVLGYIPYREDFQKQIQPIAEKLIGTV